MATNRSKCSSTIDPISCEVITASHAVVLPEMNGIPDVLEYVKSVGSIVGANQILSAYQKDGKVKIYLRFRHLVDEVVSKGVRLKGCYANAEYAVLPASRVVLSNVETEIDNNILHLKLKEHGTIVSAITTLKLDVSDSQYSHIESNTRQLYMQIPINTPLPQTLEVTQDKLKYVIPITVLESKNGNGPEVKAPGSVLGKRVPKMSRRYSSSHETSSEKEEKVTPKPVMRGRSVSRRGRSKNISLARAASSMVTKRSIKNFLVTRGKFTRGRSRGRPAFRGRGRAAFRGRSKGSAIPKSENVTSNGTVDLCSPDVFINVDKETPPRQTENIPNISSPTSFNVKSPNMCSATLLPTIMVEKTDLGYLVSNVDENMDTSTLPTFGDFNRFGTITQYPFSLKTLEEFLKSAKNNRNPEEIALAMLETNKTPGAINELCNQLTEYYEAADDHGMKVRISRLVFHISGGRRKI